ncbi:MAG: hypothetical protein ACXVQY_02285 [Actinomycetota bacterium]
MADRRKPPETPRPPQVGKRPSNPGFLLVLGLVWIAAGILALVRLTAAWKLIPGIVFIGVGLLYVRGAAATIVRRSK